MRRARGRLTWLGIFAALAVLPGSLGGAHATPFAYPTAMGWAPANAGVMWWYPGSSQNIPAQQPPGSVSPLGAWWLTRRIAANPLVPGSLFMGSFMHGLYASAGGGAWATLTPKCWLPRPTPTVMGSALPAQVQSVYTAAYNAVPKPGELDICGVEGIAFDSVRPNRVYVSGYSITLTGNPPITPILDNGGVYVSDDFGVTFTKLVGGFRGNALAVSRAPLSLNPLNLNAPTEIVAGFIQHDNGAAGVGVTPLDDSGGLLNGQQSSIAISVDSGGTWHYRALPDQDGFPCADIPATSKRLTPSIAINPAFPAQIFAGTNAGLWSTADLGNTWNLVQRLCGGVWGLAFTPDGSTLFVGDRNGQIKRATDINPLNPLGTGLQLIASLPSTPANPAIQSLLIDPRDISPQYLYAARWNPASSTSNVNAAVYRVRISNGTSTQMGDPANWAVTTIDNSWPVCPLPPPAPPNTCVPRPFPLTYRTNPSLFLALNAVGPTTPQLPELLYVSTIFRGVFVRAD